MGNPKMPEQENSLPDFANVFYTCASAYNGCILPPIRSNFGPRAFAGYPLSLVGMLVYSAWCPLLAWYVIPWLVMLAYRRITCDSTQHSRCQGAALYGLVNQTLARLVEPLICYGLAVFCEANDEEALGRFFRGLVGSLLFVLWADRAAERAEAITIADAGWRARQAYRGGR